VSTNLLNAEQRATAGRVIDSDSKRFTDLVRTAGLDPATDLRAKPLRRIVLQPGEDVTGFDFSGSDLSGAVFRRVDLSGAILTDALLDGADLRGATLPVNGLGDAQRNSALTGTPPPALRQGPNRLWPVGLRAEINDILSNCTDDDALATAARGHLDAERDVLAEHLYRVLLDWLTVALAENDEKTLFTRYFLAHLILRQGRVAEAETAFRALLPVLENVLESDHPYTLAARHDLAHAILDQGRAAEAETAFRALLPVMENVLESDHLNSLITNHNLSCAILDQGRAAEAEAAFRALLPVREKVSGTEHHDTISLRLRLCQALLEGDAERDAGHVLSEIPNEAALMPKDAGLNDLVRAFLADLQGDADRAEGYLAEAEQSLAHFATTHSTRRELDCYRRTRTPGGAGGTTLWMITDLPDDDVE